MKIVVGMGLCTIGVIVWAASLFAALVIVYPTIMSIGVITGGAIIVSGIALICLPTHSIRVPYFDQRP
jgi:hypothetical protein